MIEKMHEDDIEILIELIHVSGMSAVFLNLCIFNPIITEEDRF